MSRFLQMFLAALIVVPVCFAQAKDEKTKSAGPAAKDFIVAIDQVKWEAPSADMMTGTPSVDPGGTLRYALVQGDPMKPGPPFTIRLTCTDGYKVAPHWHPTAENLLVLKGTFAIARGDKFDPAAAQDMATGTYGYMPARMHHFGVCKGDTDILIYGMGPFKINWLSPKKPSTKKSAAGN